MFKKILEKIKQKRFEKEKAKYIWLELHLRKQGVKHIRYTQYGVPLPDWEKLIAEDLERFNGEKRSEYP